MFLHRTLAFSTVLALGGSLSGTARAEDPPSTPMLGLGVSGLLSLYENGRGDYDAVGTYGVDVSLRLNRFLTIGARRLGPSWGTRLNAGRLALGATPFVGFAFRHGNLEPYYELGVATQVRMGGAQSTDFGLAVYTGAGFRFFLVDWLSVGAEGAVHVALTDFLNSTEALSVGAVWLSIGLVMTFHIG